MAGGKDKKLGVGKMQRRGWVPEYGTREPSAMGELLVKTFGSEGGRGKGENEAKIVAKRYSLPIFSHEDPSLDTGQIGFDFGSCEIKPRE